MQGGRGKGRNDRSAPRDDGYAVRDDRSAPRDDGYAVRDDRSTVPDDGSAAHDDGYGSLKKNG